jgi:hypothetical protein
MTHDTSVRLLGYLKSTGWTGREGANAPSWVGGAE